MGLFFINRVQGLRGAVLDVGVLVPVLSAAGDVGSTASSWVGAGEPGFDEELVVLFGPCALLPCFTGVAAGAGLVVSPSNFATGLASSFSFFALSFLSFLSFFFDLSEPLAFVGSSLTGVEDVAVGVFAPVVDVLT